ncbi:MAG TPA: PAS domain-containing protein, partial [Myxococcaceae bacterium]|nr:PAS domain-containing protein [Myxococcaceae bacterium]
MSVPRPIPLSAALSVVLPALATLALRHFAPDAKWVHEPVHSSIETAGGLLALAMAAVLQWRREYQTSTAHLRWVVTALVCMGLMDVAHAWLHVSPAFFWSRALPTLFGGLLIAGVWMPAAWTQGPSGGRLPLTAGLLTLPLCAALVLMPHAWPVAFDPDGSYTLWARLLNVVGGAGFVTSAIFFLARYRRTQAGEDLVFANHALLFGAAGFLFGFSHLWGAIWWLFHGLRLLAYLVVLRHVLQVYRGLQEAEAASLVRRLEQSEEQMRLITDALPVLVSFVRPDHHYGYVNRSYTDWFGLPAGHFLGRHLRDVIGEAAYASTRPHLERALSGESFTFEQALPYARGGPRHIRASYMPRRNARGQIEGVVALVMDITAEKRALERAERLQTFTSALSRALTPEDVAQATLREVTEGIKARAGTFFVLDPESGTLRLLHALRLPAGTSVGYEVIPLDAPVPIAAVVRSGAPEWLESVEEMLRRYPVMAASARLSGHQAWAALPLLGRTGPLGGVVLGFEHAQALGEEDRAFLLALSQQAAQALERASLYLAAQAGVQVREDFLSVAGHEL